MKHVSDTLLSLPDQTEPAEPRVAELLRYLEDHLPAYPFDPAIDAAFVEELAADFPEVDLLEQTKTFRWYYDNEPLAHVKKPRVKLRRWIANAAKPRQPW